MAGIGPQSHLAIGLVFPGVQGYHVCLPPCLLEEFAWGWPGLIPLASATTGPPNEGQHLFIPTHKSHIARGHPQEQASPSAHSAGATAELWDHLEAVRDR